jgi:hypothetical protein
MSLHSSGVVSVRHWRVFGMQLPLQLPPEHKFGHVRTSFQVPVSSHSCSLNMLGPPQRLLAGLQSPPHTPAPVQTFMQVSPGVHTPRSLHVSTVSFCPQCLLSGLHTPAHAPSLQIASQCSFYIQVPVAVHTSTSALDSAQRVAPT